MLVKTEKQLRAETREFDFTKGEIFKLKEELSIHYWSAAKTDATLKAWDNGKRKRPKNWEKDYA